MSLIGVILRRFLLKFAVVLMLIKSRILFAFSCAASMVFVPLCYAETMQDAVARAIVSHPVVEGAQAGATSAQHSKAVERSNYFPQISADVTGGSVYQDNSTSRGLTTTRGAANSGYGEGNIALRQMVFDGLETKNRVRAADARLQARDYSLMDAQDQIALRTVNSYIDMLRLRIGIKILEEYKTRIKDYESRITDMVIEGAADETERQQARDVTMVVESLMADYEGQVLSVRAAYEEAVGALPPDNMYVPPLVTSYISEDIEHEIQTVLDIHPLVQSAKMDSKAARFDMKAANADFYPDVSGELSYSKLNKDDIVGGENIDARAVVRMSWGISLGGREFSSLRQKRFDHYEARAKAEEIERQLKRDVQQAYASYKTFTRKHQLAQERVSLNKSLLSTYETQFEGARVNLLQLMKADSQLFNAMLEESDNRFYALSAQYNLLASLGRLRPVLAQAFEAPIESKAEE